MSPALEIQLRNQPTRRVRILTFANPPSVQMTCWDHNNDMIASRSFGSGEMADMMVWMTTTLSCGLR